MAKNKSYFEDRGIKISFSSPEAIKIANDKIALARIFPEYMPKQTIVHDALDCVAFTTSLGYPNKLICCKLTDKFGMNRFITLGMLTELVENTDESVISKNTKMVRIAASAVWLTTVFCSTL